MILLNEGLFDSLKKDSPVNLAKKSEDILKDFIKLSKGYLDFGIDVIPNMLSLPKQYLCDSEYRAYLLSFNTICDLSDRILKKHDFKDDFQLAHYAYNHTGKRYKETDDDKANQIIKRCNTYYTKIIESNYNKMKNNSIDNVIKYLQSVPLSEDQMRIGNKLIGNWDYIMKFFEIAACGSKVSESVKLTNNIFENVSFI